MTKPKITLKTAADYAKLFNDFGKILGGYEPKVTADDVLLDAKRVSVVISLGKHGSMTLNLNRREFGKSVDGIVVRLIADLAKTK